MKIVSRPYNIDEDFTSIMAFLYETFKNTNSYLNWFPDRFESNHDYYIEDIRIWEEIIDSISPLHRKIVAVANPETNNVYYIQIDPSYSFIEREIVKWIEKHSVEKKKDPSKKEKLRIKTIEGNSTREILLYELGYQKVGEIDSYVRIRPSNLPIPDFKCPEGFEIRNVKGKSDYQQLARLIRLIFGHGDWFTADILEQISHRSFYKQNLDLVAVTPDGTFASFCTFRMDPMSKITQLEPMATHPNFRKLGLAKLLIFEGLKRAMKYDPAFFYIGGAANTLAANKLYDSVGFTKKLAEETWFKEI
ncbi:MAG: GNAT family N-acetyltransferase [Promethearchaeota archaeon]